MPSKDPAQFLPTSVQKSYFMLSRSARAVLDTALGKYRPGRTDLISVGGITQLKPALRLMTYYRLMAQEVTGPEVVISYTRRTLLPSRKTNRILAPEFEIGRFSGNILRKALFRFQPDALELRAERHVNFCRQTAIR